MTDSIKAAVYPGKFKANQLTTELQKLGFENLQMKEPNSKFPDLLKGMGIDGFELSPEASNSLQYSRAQFEINYQVVKSINSANGTQTEQLSFSFKASYEFLQKISGGPAVEPTKAPETPEEFLEGQSQISTIKSDSPEQSNFLSKLSDFFSPEKTAERILDFALHLFPKSSFLKNGESEESRKNFADFIGKAIQTGFDQAFQILGNIPEKVKSIADETHDLVFKGLEDFVKNGLPEEKATLGGLYERIEAIRLEMSFSVKATKTQIIDSNSYDTNGKTAKKSEISGKKVDVTS